MMVACPHLIAFNMILVSGIVVGLVIAIASVVLSSFVAETDIIQMWIASIQPHAETIVHRNFDANKMIVSADGTKNWPTNAEISFTGKAPGNSLSYNEEHSDPSGATSIGARDPDLKLERVTTTPTESESETATTTTMIVMMQNSGNGTGQSGGGDDGGGCMGGMRGSMDCPRMGGGGGAIANASQAVKTDEVIIPQGASQVGFKNPYQPPHIEVQNGTAVTWTNKDDQFHSVTDTTNTFDSDLFGPGTTWAHTFDTPGKYDYYCLIHPWMKGIVDVVS
jgi:plastocyanin